VTPRWFVVSAVAALAAVACQAILGLTPPTAGVVPSDAGLMDADDAPTAPIDASDAEAGFCVGLQGEFLCDDFDDPAEGFSHWSNTTTQADGSVGIISNDYSSFPNSLRALLPGAPVADGRSADAFLYKDTDKGIPAYVQFDAHLVSASTAPSSYAVTDLVIFGMLVNADDPTTKFGISFGYSHDGGRLNGALLHGDGGEIVPSALIEPPPTGWFQVKITYDATLAKVSIAIEEGTNITTRVLRMVPDTAKTVHIVCGATTPSDLSYEVHIDNVLISYAPHPFP
jgi:hypothetical protein